jgi:hypothetical protein
MPRLTRRPRGSRWPAGPGCRRRWRCPGDDAREGTVEDAHLGQHPARDPDAGGGEGQADDGRRHDVTVDEEPCPEAGRDGQDEPQDADRERHGTHGQEVVDADLEADHEEQDDDAELGEDLRAYGHLGPAKGVGAHDEAPQQLADDPRLPDPSEDLLPCLGGHEQDEQAEERGPGALVARHGGCQGGGVATSSQGIGY